MGKGLLFLCCSCFILVLTIVNLSIGPITSGAVKRFFTGGNYPDWGTANCKAAKDGWDAAKDAPNANDDAIKYGAKYVYETCQRAKGMHDMEYTAFIFDIVIGFICGLLGLLHLFDLKKDFVSNTGLIGLICGVVGFVLTFVYVIFNGLVYTTVYMDGMLLGEGILKRDGDYVIAEKEGSSNFKCLYFDNKDNGNSKYAKISDLGKKQYNYDKDGMKDYDSNDADDCSDDLSFTAPSGETTHIYDLIASLCTTKEKPTLAEVNSEFSDIDNTITNKFDNCQKIYIAEDKLETEIKNKDLSDRFLTTLILNLFVCLASLGLALFGFLLFRTPGDF